jgi:Family of unknown function (DUF5995)
MPTVELPPAIVELMARMDHSLAAFGPNDARRHFLGVYRRTAEAVGEEIVSGGFLDGEWVERWDVIFANLYLDALDAWNAGEPTPGPWEVAFQTARDRPDMQPLRQILFGLNAHINYDLPQALIGAITDEEFDDPVLVARRARDHEHIDAVLLARVGAEDELIEGKRTLVDRILTPLNRIGTKRFLVEARQKVWRNARALSAARREGPEALLRRIDELDRLSAARVADLVAPGQVILKLARKGFGVVLSGA